MRQNVCMLQCTTVRKAKLNDSSPGISRPDRKARYARLAINVAGAYRVFRCTSRNIKRRWPEIFARAAAGVRQAGCGCLPISQQGPRPARGQAAIPSRCCAGITRSSVKMTACCSSGPRERKGDRWSRRSFHRGYELASRVSIAQRERLSTPGLREKGAPAGPGGRTDRVWNLFVCRRRRSDGRFRDWRLRQMRAIAERVRRGGRSRGDVRKSRATATFDNTGLPLLGRASWHFGRRDLRLRARDQSRSAAFD